MRDKKSYIEENSKIWDKRSDNNDIWSIPVTSEMITQARKGTWSIVLTPAKPIDEKSSHKARKTYISSLIDAGVSSYAQNRVRFKKV